MAKKGDKYTSPDGKTWVFTEGGNWREYVNGKATNNVSKGSTPPGGGSSAQTASGAPGPTTAVENNTPQAMSPQATEYMRQTNADLQAQVAAGAINSAQAQQEAARQQQWISSLSPALQQNALTLHAQVQSGGINQYQLENEIYNQQKAENSTQPNTNVNLDAKSSTSQVSNEISDVAKGSAIAGNTLSNANQSSDFGSRSVTFDPITGQPIIKDQLSGANQAALGGVQGTSVKASDVAQGLLGNQYGQFVQAAGPQSGYSDPALEKAVYARLTQGFDDQKAREQEQLGQTLANRGIPVGSEAYSRAMKDFSTNWDTRYENARNDATQQGTATALQRQQNNIGGLSALNGGVSTLGQTAQGGVYLPQFQGFNAVAYNQPDVAGLYNTQVTMSEAEKTRQAQIEQQKIAANAQLKAAGIAAEASKSNAETAANANKPSGNPAFSSSPPG